jgi:ketosteroid isomerase-like protein
VTKDHTVIDRLLTIGYVDHLRLVYDDRPEEEVMSERENVALIQKLLEAFGRGDVGTILDNCTDDCRFYCPGPAIVPYAGTRTGRKEIQSYFDSLIGTQSNPVLKIEQFVAQDDNVVAIGSYAAEIRSTGKRVESPVVLTFKIEDGRVKRHMVIGDTAALAASYSSSSAAGG